MSHGPYEFVISYQNVSLEQVHSDIESAFQKVDSVLKAANPLRKDWRCPTAKQLTSSSSNSKVAVGVYSTYQVTEMIRDRLLASNSNLALVKDIKELRR